MSKETPKPKIKPVISVQDISIQQEPPRLKEPSNGKYTLADVATGNEFTVNAKTYNKTFKDNPKFIVKKNPQ